MSNRSGRSGRSWYRLSSIVRPTPYSSRDPSPPPRHVINTSSPRHIINPPPSPPLQSLSPPLPPLSPDEVQETKPSLVQSPWYTKHDLTKLRDEHESSHQRNVLTLSERTPMPPQRMSPPKEVQETKPSPVQLPRSILKYDPPKPREENDQNAHQINVPSQRMSSPNEVKEAKPSSVQLPKSILKHDPLKSRHEQESAHRTNVLTLPEKTSIASQPMSTPKDFHEAKVKQVHSPSSMLKHEQTKVRQEHDTAHQKNVLTLSEKTPLAPQPQFPPKEVQNANPNMSSKKHDEPPKARQADHQNVFMLSDKTNLVHEINEERQQQQQQHESNEVSMHTPGVMREPNEEHQQQQSEFDDFIMGTQSVITISGENKGAMMEIIRSANSDKKGERLGKEEKNTKSKNRSNNDGNHFVNSNVQIINGSVVYNSTETHYDPGVHLRLCRKPGSDNGFIIKDHGRNGYTSSIN